MQISHILPSKGWFELYLIGGGYALWKGGWISEQFQPCVMLAGGMTASGDEAVLERPQTLFHRLCDNAAVNEDGRSILLPATALADGILHKDHRVIQPDEIETSFLKRDHLTDLVDALIDLGCDIGHAMHLAAPYKDCLEGSQEEEPDFLVQVC